MATRLDGDALAQLTGEACDALLRPLTGARLPRYDDGTCLGTGNTLLAKPVPRGVNRITILIVTRVSLPFLKPDIPTSISSAAQELRITALSRLPATLTVDRRGFSLTSNRSSSSRN